MVFVNRISEKCPSGGIGVRSIIVTPPWRFCQVARAVSVDSRAILEALRSIYRANDLARELTGVK